MTFHVNTIKKQPPPQKKNRKIVSNFSTYLLLHCSIHDHLHLCSPTQFQALNIFCQPLRRYTQDFSIAIPTSCKVFSPLQPF